MKRKKQLNMSDYTTVLHIKVDPQLGPLIVKLLKQHPKTFGLATDIEKASIALQESCFVLSRICEDGTKRPIGSGTYHEMVERFRIADDANPNLYSIDRVE